MSPLFLPFDTTLHRRSTLACCRRSVSPSRWRSTSARSCLAICFGDRPLPDRRRRDRPRPEAPFDPAQLSDRGAPALHLRGDPPGDAPVLLRGRQGRHAVQPRPARRRLPARQDARSTCGRSARTTTSTAPATNGWPIRSRPRRSTTSRSASPSAARTAPSPTRPRCFNISAMSFGALSANAIRALNGGAKLGGFAHDTGEGGFSPYHREGGGDIIWEIGSGYFGARNPGRHLLARAVRRRRHQPAGQDGRAQAQPGRQARPWRRAAGAQGQRRRSR